MTVLNSTHDIAVVDDVVIKRFTSWNRGEAPREWRGLALLDRFAPGLAPRPIEAALEAEPPEVTMSRIDGSPLRGTVVSRPAIRALARALSTVHDAVPSSILNEVPVGAWTATRVDAHVRERMTELPDTLCPLAARAALTAGKQWLMGTSLKAVSTPDAIVPVFGLTDGNIANYLYDGSTVRLLDFEDSGRSDRAFELAEIAGHPSTWVDSTFNVDYFLSQFDLAEAEQARVQYLRRLNALLWLDGLLADNEPSHRNPPGAALRQADRVLALLG
ncbi:phosphotransferase [Streptomyces sp. NPDC058268]|uniref:phosphotransferase n=1 Tax=Streptomyces sp. NPDC058268 TaxID=3346413 RepID=UPI0036E83ED3